MKKYSLSGLVFVGAVALSGGVSPTADANEASAFTKLDTAFSALAQAPQTQEQRAPAVARPLPPSYSQIGFVTATNAEGQVRLVTSVDVIGLNRPGCVASALQTAFAHVRGQAKMGVQITCVDFAQRTTLGQALAEGRAPLNRAYAPLQVFKGFGLTCTFPAAAAENNPTLTDDVARGRGDSVAVKRFVQKYCTKSPAQP